MTQPDSEHSKREEFPFRKIAIASFLRGGLSLLFGIVFLLLIKPDLDDKNYVGLGIKLIAAVSFLTIGFRSIWKGYLKEYNFSLKDIFDRARDIKVNLLMAQRASDHYGLAQEYMKIFDSKNLSYTKSEKGKVNSWQFIFLNWFPKRDFPKYLITFRFRSRILSTTNQSRFRYLVFLSLDY